MTSAQVYVFGFIIYLLIIVASAYTKIIEKTRSKF